MKTDNSITAPVNHKPPKSIQMVDLISQYDKIKEEIDENIQEVINSGFFINGPKVKSFAASLSQYLNVKHVIPCGNGTDALQIALMALDLKQNDEVIVPAFTYAATAEVIALLQLKPVMVDVDLSTFNVTTEIIDNAITSKTRAIIPVHLFGQSSEMEGIMDLARKHNIYVIEDNAQAIGADYIFSDGKVKKMGTIGHIGCTSFYPSKNLGAFGDGGAIFSNDEDLGKKLARIANHGQSKKYYHEVIGCNSRLDAIQAAILEVKLKYLDHYCDARRKVADFYDKAFADMDGIRIPYRADYSTHVFHQYTLSVKNGKRDALKNYLKEKHIPSVVYYPLPLYRQNAYAPFAQNFGTLPITEQLCEEVLSLPIHTEMKEEQLNYIVETVKGFFD